LPYRRIVIFVEGKDDERLLKKIIEIKAEELIEHMRFYQFAKRKYKEVCKFIRNIPKVNSDYIFVHDLNDSECFPVKIENLSEKYKDLEKDKVIIVVKSIESWYLAGINKESCKELKIKYYENTSNVNKQNFSGLIPKEYGSRIDFMSEELKYFNIGEAKKRNESFKYFYDTFLQSLHKQSEEN